MYVRPSPCRTNPSEAAVRVRVRARVKGALPVWAVLPHHREAGVQGERRSPKKPGAAHSGGRTRTPPTRT